MTKKRFKKGQKIKTAEGKFKCIMVDNEFALFGKFRVKKNGMDNVNYRDTFVVSNIPNIDDFEYEKIEETAKTTS